MPTQRFTKQRSVPPAHVLASAAGADRDHSSQLLWYRLMHGDGLAFARDKPDARRHMVWRQLDRTLKGTAFVEWQLRTTFERENSLARVEERAVILRASCAAPMPDEIVIDLSRHDLGMCFELEMYPAPSALLKRVQARARALKVTGSPGLNRDLSAAPLRALLLGTQEFHDRTLAEFQWNLPKPGAWDELQQLHSELGRELEAVRSK